MAGEWPVKKLNLPLMSSVNKSRTQTAFTISIESKRGVTTGISAHDRAKTIKVAIKPNSNRHSIVSPGHVFPIISKETIGSSQTETIEERSLLMI